MIIDLKKSDDSYLFGNKAKGLYDLIKLNLEVPKGFAISFDTKNTEIKKYIEKKCSSKNLYVVRSSSNLEDSASHSFAGLFDTIVGVKKNDLFEAINKVRIMEGNERILDFCKKIKKDISNIKVSVVVQQIVNSEFSGIVFTKNPSTNNENEIYIESALGLGEYVVSGEVNPDKYYFNKTSRKIKVEESTQHKMLTINKYKIQEEPVFSYTQKTSNKLIKELSINSIKIEKYFQKPMDIEFAIYKNKIYYLQARPITT